MSNFGTNDFQIILVDRISGHDPGPGDIFMTHPINASRGASFGAQNLSWTDADPVCIVQTNQQRAGPLLRVIHTEAAFRQGMGPYIEVVSNATPVFKVRGMMRGNDQNTIVEIPSGDYGTQGAPILRIGGNTSSIITSRAGSTTLCPGAIRMDCQVDTLAITMWAFNKRGTRPGATRSGPRLVYSQDANYRHGRGPLVDAIDWEVLVAAPSFSKFKTILGEGTSKEDALAFICDLATHLFRFRYNAPDGSEDEGHAVIENGIVLDHVDDRYIDGDRVNQDGRINEFTLYGDLVASVAYLKEQLDEERSRNDHLQEQIDQLTARVEAIEGADF